MAGFQEQVIWAGESESHIQEQLGKSSTGQALGYS